MNHIYENDQTLVTSIYGEVSNENGQKIQVIQARLKPGVEYSIYFMEFQINTLSQNLSYRYAQETATPIADTAFEKITQALAKFFILIGKTANWVLSIALGRTLTIDDIVFNRYDDIRLDFFTYDSDGNEVTVTSGLVNSLKSPINKCYKVFSQIAIVGYMIILVYVGIVMMLNASSPDKKASGKKAFMCWVTGIIILFTYPFFMRYLILLEDAFVTDIGKQSIEKSSTEVVLDGDDNNMVQDPNKTIDYDKNLGNDYDDYDYMSIIGREAQTTLSLGIATAYLILTWQLIMMLVYYYKRAFVIAFLIMIFPFVALTYVIDKLNDGKSQALSGWTKEFTTGIVVQIFHAIVYVFVVTTIYKTAQSGNIDTILVMIAATFMFEGENIVKQIFGVGKTTAMGTVAQNGVKIAALAKFAMKTAGKTAVTGAKVAKATAKGLKHAYDGGKTYYGFRYAGVGRLSALGFAIKENSDTYKRLNADWRTMKGVFGGAYTENPLRNRRIASLLPSKGDITQNIHDTAESIDTINNSNNLKDNADALYKLQELLKKRRSGAMTDMEMKQFDAMMRASKISVDQLDNISDSMVDASIMAGNGVNYKRITQHLKLTVDYSFSNLAGAEKDTMVNKIFAATMYNFKNGYVDEDAIKDRIKSGWDEKRENSYNFGRGAKFRDGKRVDTQEKVREMQKNARALQRQLATQISGYDKLSAKEKKELDEVGNAISYITLSEGEQPDKMQKHLDSLKRNFGANQKVVEDFIKSHNVNFDDVQKRIDYMNQSREAFEARREGLVTQFEKKFANTPLSDDEKKEVAKVADYIAKLEMIETGKATTYEAYEAVRGIENGGEIAQNLLKISNLDKDIETLKYLISKAMLESQQGNASDAQSKKALDWAKANVENTENAASSHTEKNPVTSIYDIINAAKMKGGGKVSSIEDLYTNSDTNMFVSEKVNATIEATKEFARKALKGEKAVWKIFTNDEGREFAKQAYQEQDVGKIRSALRHAVEVANSDGQEDLPTINGYTEKDLIRAQYFDSAHRAKENMTMASDLLLKPLLAFTGGVVGMALTNDGMPIGEAASGMTAGANAADTVDDFVANKILRDTALQNKKKDLMSKVNARLKEEEKAAYNAKKARKAEKEAKVVDTNLEIRLVSANLYVNSEGEEHAIVKIIADNAQYMSIGEPNIIGAWVPYTEESDYEIQNPYKTPCLFIRVKDASGNVKDARIILGRLS